MALFTPVGQPRELALTTLRLYVEAVAASQSELAGAILATAQPESPDDSVATVAGTIGVALDLLDEILSGQRSDAPAGIGARTRIPKAHWVGAQHATSSTSLEGGAPSGHWDR